MIRLLLSLFRRRSVVVTTYKVKKSDLSQLRLKKCRQLARELGMEWEES